MSSPNASIDFYRVPMANIFFYYSQSISSGILIRDLIKDAADLINFCVFLLSYVYISCSKPFCHSDKVAR